MASEDGCPSVIESLDDDAEPTTAFTPQGPVMSKLRF